MGSVEPTRHDLSDGRTVTIRCAAAGDASAMLEHGREILSDNDFACRQKDELDFTLEEEARLIDEHFRHPGKLWLVADRDGAVVGSLMFSTGPTRRLAHRGTLGMGLDRAWRGQGLGSLLMRRFLEWAEQEPSVEKVGLAVFSTNQAAIRLYRKFGFVEEGRRPCEIKMSASQYVDDILMYRWVSSSSPLKPEPEQ